MDLDPLSRQASLDRCKQAGIGAGKWGSKPEANPYYRNAAFPEEEAVWEEGRKIGAAESEAAK